MAEVAAAQKSLIVREPYQLFKDMNGKAADDAVFECAGGATRVENYYCQIAAAAGSWAVPSSAQTFTIAATSPAKNTVVRFQTSMTGVAGCSCRVRPTLVLNGAQRVMVRAAALQLLCCR